jgi:hypothetical protein
VRGISDLALSGMIGIDLLKRGGDEMSFLEEDNLRRGHIIRVYSSLQVFLLLMVVNVRKKL